MNVRRICFLGTRTSNFEATAALFRGVLGLRTVHAEAEWSIFGLPSGRGDFVEVFGPDHQNADVFPAEVREGIVVAQTKWLMSKVIRRQRAESRSGEDGPVDRVARMAAQAWVKPR